MKTEELEQQLEKALTSNSFEQDNMGFEMPSMSGLLSTGKSASLPLMAVGSALAGTAGGFVSGFLGNFGQSIAGLPSMVAGGVLKMTIGKTGKLADVANGVMLAGLSQLVSGLLGGSIGNLFTQELSDQTKQQFRQEQKPCDQSIQSLRSDVRW